jgi:dTDP-4-amino-4,6-dideoxygalactose transaminase
MTPVRFVDLGAMHAQIAEDVARGFQDVLSSGAFVGGPDVRAFEDEFAAYSGRQHCVGVGNGTDAIEMVLRAAGIGAGDEVIVPANTFIATVEAVVRAGATPVLVDVDEKFLLIDPAAVSAAIGPRTAAIVPVHLYGQLAPMNEIQEIARDHHLAVLEDAAQAQGATQDGGGIGTGSLAAATSFYPGKNLGAYGDAGGVVCDDPALAQRIRRIGNHGGTAKYQHDEFGFNSRLDTLQAVVLRAKLRHLDTWNAQRRAAADRYTGALAATTIGTPSVAPGNEHVWHLYIVRVHRRDAVLDRLGEQGIGVGIHYPAPVHLTGAFANLGHPAGAFPIAEQVAAEMLSLPMHPGLDPEQQRIVVEALIHAHADAERSAS